ncbi:MAG: hypothetical protein L3V56_07210 [Candidatus Magnetoovum sp. WYHC-5]|nr:hypothetical protein [Candidatus Magnetoovum sp. WYHC-5]
MSLLTEVLTKIQARHPKQKDVHPELVSMQKERRKRKALYKKALMLSVGLVIFVLSGLFGLYYLGNYKQKLIDSNIKLKQNFEQIPVLDKATTAIPTVAAVAQNEQPQYIQDFTQFQKETIQETPISPTPTYNKIETKQLDHQTAVAAKNNTQVKTITTNEPNKPPAKDKQTSDDKKAPATQNTIERTPDNTVLTQIEIDNRIYRGEDYEKNNLFNEAVHEYEIAFSLDTNNYRILNKLVYCNMKAGNYKKAINYAETAIKLNNAYIPLLINLAISYASVKRYEEAENTFKMAVETSPGNLDLLYNFALFYEKINKPNKALEIYETLSKQGDARGQQGILRITYTQTN